MLVELVRKLAAIEAKVQVLTVAVAVADVLAEPVLVGKLLCTPVHDREHGAGSSRGHAGQNREVAEGLNLDDVNRREQALTAAGREGVDKGLEDVPLDPIADALFRNFRHLLHIVEGEFRPVQAQRVFDSHRSPMKDKKPFVTQNYIKR